MSFYWGFILAIFGVIHMTSCASLRLYCNDDPSLKNYTEQSLSRAELLLDSPCFNESRMTVIHAAGYNNQLDGAATTTIISGFINLTEFNVLLLNWEKEASTIFVTNTSLDTPIKQFSYVVSAVPEAFRVGTELGLALLRMARLKLKLVATYLLGHSLGAHLMGEAGRTVKLNGDSVALIHGLDPAGPLFNNPKIFISLSKNDAKKVICTHTDPGNYGTNDTICHLDYLVNFVIYTNTNKTKRVQPGCPVGNFPTLSKEAICSHDRSWMLLVEALRNATSLVASRANNVWNWIRGLGDCSDIVNLGLDAPETKQGLYFMNTSASSPYGLGIQGSCPSA